MADYGFQTFGSDGRLWVSTDDLFGRLIRVIDVPGDQIERYEYIDGISPDNTSLVLNPNSINQYPRYAEVNSGYIRYEGGDKTVTGAVAPSSKILVFRIR